jgi:hypothetical protein
MTQCKICGMPSEFFDEAKILRKFLIKYFRCATCGFIQTETPYWLDEAYSSAIAKQDTGILERNLLNRELTTAVLNLLCPEAESSVDFGGGHGVFVRLMRDRGFNFVWHDPHATNDYAPGFEYQEGHNYDFLTAFEVLEHLPDPIAGLSRMMSLSPDVFVSTLLLPQPAPKLSDWWYYATLSGQHVSFYTPEALRVIAKKFGRKLLSRGSYHLFTTAPKSRALFRIAASMRGSRIMNTIRKRRSLSQSDYQLLTK